MTDVPFLHALRGVALMVSACFVLHFCAGCSMTQMEVARSTIAFSAQGAVGIDHAISAGFRAARLQVPQDEDEMRRYGIVVTSLLLTRMAIIDAEATLDAIEAGAAGEIGDVIACVVEAVQNLIALLPTLDVDVPEALVTVMSMASAFAGTCGTHDVDTSAIPHASEALSIAH